MTAELRDALRARLAPFIDPDDDTMPTVARVDGAFTVAAASVVDGLMEVVGPLHQMYVQAMADLGRAMDQVNARGKQQFPIGTHRYSGDGFDAPCTASGYGTACGATEYDHTETTWT
ncbi:hypothetical protein [Streptomyces sp. NPDC047990]|uniref:hypothetical protein n=1 Tax=Streptomyces sp. NPDC047990 TaxID=3365496 RepID=UPI00371A57F6